MYHLLIHITLMLENKDVVGWNNINMQILSSPLPNHIKEKIESSHQLEPKDGCFVFTLWIKTKLYNSTCKIFDFGYYSYVRFIAKSLILLHCRKNYVYIINYNDQLLVLKVKYFKQ